MMCWWVWWPFSGSFWRSGHGWGRGGTDGSVPSALGSSGLRPVCAPREPSVWAQDPQAHSSPSLHAALEPLKGDGAEATTGD